MLLSYCVSDIKLTPKKTLTDTDPNLPVSDTQVTNHLITKPKKWCDDGIPRTQPTVLEEIGVKELLDHQDTMTETLRLKVNDGNPIEVKKIFERDDDKGICTRIVLLRDAESQKILSIGLIKIDLENLGPDFKKDLEGTYTPFGELLGKHRISVKGEVKKFYRMSTPQQKKEKFFFLTKPEEQEAFRFSDSTDIFGRYNVLTRTDMNLQVARVYEFLAADTKVK